MIELSYFNFRMLQPRCSQIHDFNFVPLLLEKHQACFALAVAEADAKILEFVHSRADLSMLEIILQLI